MPPPHYRHKSKKVLKGGIFALLVTVVLISAMIASYSLYLVTFKNQSNNDVSVTKTIEQTITEDIVSTASFLMTQELKKIVQKSESNKFTESVSQENEIMDNELEDLVSLSDEIFEALLLDVDLAWVLMGEHFTENEADVLGTVLEQVVAGYEEVSRERGYFKLRIYVHYSAGWFLGQLSATLVTLAITPIIVQAMGLGAAAGGSIGVVVGALIGATLGVGITNAVNHLVYRGGEAGYTRDLINTTIIDSWLFPPKINFQYNLYDLLFNLINFAGGSWSPGSSSVSSGSPRPRLVWA